MKKIIILLFLLFVMPVHAFRIDNKVREDFFATLKLSNKQSQKIEQIENKYNPKIVKLNSQIILNNMHCAQLKPSNHAVNKINSINANSKALEDELENIQNQKQKEILSVLNLFQKIKYRRYIKNNRHGQ